MYNSIHICVHLHVHINDASKGVLFAQGISSTWVNKLTVLHKIHICTMYSRALIIQRKWFLKFSLVRKWCCETFQGLNVHSSLYNQSMSDRIANKENTEGHVHIPPDFFFFVRFFVGLIKTWYFVRLGWQNEHPHPQIRQSRQSHHIISALTKYKWRPLIHIPGSCEGLMISIPGWDNSGSCGVELSSKGITELATMSVKNIKWEISIKVKERFIFGTTQHWTVIVLLSHTDK